MGSSKARWAPALVGRRGKWLVLVFWLVVVAAAGPLAGKLMGAEQNNASAYLPGSAESTKVLDLQGAFQNPNTLVAVIVYQRSHGLTAADRERISADATSFAGVAPLGGPIVGPVWSRDGEAAQVAVPYNLGADGWSATPAVVDKVKHIAAGSPGLSVYVTGPLGNASDSENAFKGIDGTLLYSAIAVVVVILLLTYRSPFAWLLPVISAGIALTSAEGVIYLLARHAGLVVNAESAGILTVLVFGAGTDYALLLVARYREELRRHADRHEAMAVAVRRAGPAIIASASTVIAGLLCLLIAESNSTRGLGPVAAIGIVVGLASMITLLPALLVIAGRWIFWPYRPSVGSAEPTSAGVWARIGRQISRRPRWVWIGTTLVLAALALGNFGLHADGLSEKQSFRGTPSSIVGQEVLARHFPAGLGSPVVVIADAGETSQVQAALTAAPGIASVAPPIVKDGLAYLQGTTTANPESNASYLTVEKVRSAVHAIPGAHALVAVRAQ